MSHNRQQFQFCFESYGVPVRLESNSRAILEQAKLVAKSALLDRIRSIDCDLAEQTFSLLISEDGVCTILQNREEMASSKPDPRFWRFFDSLTRILVAEFSTDMVFVHAGVVGWRGKAIILPGNSHYGKTTLVAELVRNGAEYYSDEYALLDTHGLVHPFERKLFIRTNEQDDEVELKIEELCGTTARSPAPVGCVLFTKYSEESEPNYQFLSTGQGIVEIIAQTIAIKRNTESAIKILKNAFSSAIILKSPRPDAGEFARDFLDFVDNTAI